VSFDVLTRNWLIGSTGDNDLFHQQSFDQQSLHFRAVGAPATGKE